MSVDYIARGLARLQSTGTVTQVNAGTGLQGGPITGSGSLAIDQEWLQDFIAALLVAGTNISITYDDVNGLITIAAGGFREFGTYVADPISNDETVLGYTATQPFTIAANFSGWRINVLSNPVDTVTFSVRKNGVEFGTFQIDNTGTTTFGTHSAQSIVSGDYISIVAPADVETDGPALSFAITGRGTI